MDNKTEPKKSLLSRMLYTFLTLCLFMVIRYGISYVFQLIDGSAGAVDLAKYSVTSTEDDVLSDNTSYPCFTVSPSIAGVKTFTLTATDATVDGEWKIYVKSIFMWEKVGTMKVENGKGSTTIKLDTAASLSAYTILPPDEFSGQYSFHLEIKNIKK
ncbi:MAG: hypothetical protein Q4B01_10515 [Eubacteriales bacterium]|nr:hypothetical protein [Eubacteriales bacterium]